MIKLRTISLGGGIQSSTMALMASSGEFEDMPDCAIFADTQWESGATYAYLDYLEKRLTFPLYRVTRGSLRKAAIFMANARYEPGMGVGDHYAMIPFFMLSTGGMGRRTCTADYKIQPVAQKQRELLGVKKRCPVPKDTRVENWIGISTDEASRMKDSQFPWQINRWPLIEKELIFLMRRIMVSLISL